jgi:hypothetical protein
VTGTATLLVLLNALVVMSWRRSIVLHRDEATFALGFIDF